MAACTTTLDIAPETLSDIGRIVVAWAQIDWHLREMIYLAGQMSQEVGRLVVQEPSVARRVVLLRRLLELAGKTIATDLGHFSSEIERLERLRNALAHGLWYVVDPAQPPRLRLMRDEWPPAELPPVQSRRFDSEIVELEATACRGMVKATCDLCDLTAKVRSEVLAAFRHARTPPASPRKHRSRR